MNPMHFRLLADYDLQFLEELCELLDEKLDQLDGLAREHRDPDQMGIFDRIEYIVGLGLVACQNYLTVVMGDLEKKDRPGCLQLGPMHQNGYSLAEIIHAGANYVKHHAEPLANAKSIAILEKFDVWKTNVSQVGSRFDYPMTSLFFELFEEPANFSNLLRRLDEWRSAVIEKISADDDLRI
jgi:hypothetical protein